MVRFFYYHIFMVMRLAPILIIEGRKEDLRKKYGKKFSADPEHIEVLDYALGHPFLAQTNFKYGDFLLKNLHPNSSIEEIIDDIELIKEFDRFQQSLEEKDINKYSFAGLRNAIQSHKETSKSQQNKFDSSGAKKLYEDSNILIVKPLTYEASCKYGSGTRWCTTMANTPTYFNQYTSGHDQSLYYVILKKFDRSNKFYKIAIHKKPGEETWYDATDERMTEREKEVFNLGAPKVIQTIRADWENEFEKNQLKVFEKMFNWENYAFFDISKHLARPEDLPDLGEIEIYDYDSDMTVASQQSMEVLESLIDLYLSDVPQLKEHPYIRNKMREDAKVYAETIFLSKMTRKNFLSQLRQVDNGDNSARMHEVVNQTIGQIRENSKFSSTQRTELEKFYKGLRKDLGLNEIENPEEEKE